MKYEAPELTLLPAIEAIQNLAMGKRNGTVREFATPPISNEPSMGYADWES